MEKNAYFFSHDCNARNDEKILAVRMKHKVEGYGVYFMIIERLVESTDYMSIKDYNLIAFDLRVSAELVKSIVEKFGLFEFTEDGEKFFSSSLIRRMEPLDNQRKQRSAAGKASAEKRRNSTTVERPLNNTTTTDAQNFNKGKDIKDIKKIPSISPKEERGGNFNFNDGIERNYEGLERVLKDLKLPPDQFNQVCELCSYGEIGHPVWKVLRTIQDNREKFHTPGLFILSRIKDMKHEKVVQ